PPGGRGSPRPHGDGPPAAAPQPGCPRAFCCALAGAGGVPRHRSGGVLSRPGESAGPARQVCAACPVRQPCPDYAITNRIAYGVWGGLTERERRALRSGWVRATRQDRDRAVLAADAAGFTAAAIGRSFGLSRTSVTRVLSRDADRRS